MIDPAVLEQLFGDRRAPDGSLARDNFARWFGESRVVDAEGKPLVVYHGTPESFDHFRAGSGWYVHGIYFTDGAARAGEFAEMFADEGGGENVVPVYLSIKKPYIFTTRNNDIASNVQLMRELGFSDEYADSLIEREKHAGIVMGKLQSMGHDGLIVLDRDMNEYIAFSPSQIKSATANCGAFSRSDPSITDRLARETAVAKLQAASRRRPRP